FSSRRRHTRFSRDWSSDVCSSDLAERLLKLVAIAAKAAVISLQLVQARDGRDNQSVRIAFNAGEVATLAALNRNLEAQSKRLRRSEERRVGKDCRSRWKGMER